MHFSDIFAQQKLSIKKPIQNNEITLDQDIYFTIDIIIYSKTYVTLVGCHCTVTSFMCLFAMKKNGIRSNVRKNKLSTK